MKTRTPSVFPQVDPGDQQHPTLFGLRMGQWWQDLQIWEWFLNDHPEIGEVIEIGTWEGGFATFLALQCWSRGMVFRSFDQHPLWINTVQRNPTLWPLVERSVMLGDTWTTVSDYVRQRIAVVPRERIALFCDNGDKPREFRIFAPLLQAGDFVIMHDWSTVTGGGEFYPSDVDSTLVEPVYADICDRHDSHTRFFRKRGT